MTHAIKEPEKAVLTREDFLNRIKVPTSKVEIPDIGEIAIRGLTAPEVQRIKSGATNLQNGKEAEDMFAILTVITGMVSPALTHEDVAVLKKEGKFGTVHKISTEIWKLSGVGEETKNA